jgi:CheY-like chemotaxis protein
MRRRSAASPPSKLLCVDDDLGARQFYQRILEGHGYHVLLAESGAQALQLLRKHLVAAVVSDYEMPGMNGGELAAAIKRRRVRTPVVLISGHDDVIDHPPVAVDAALSKGAPLDELLKLIERVSTTAAKPRASKILPLLPLAKALATVALAALMCAGYSRPS